MFSRQIIAMFPAHANAQSWEADCTARMSVNQTAEFLLRHAMWPLEVC